MIIIGCGSIVRLRLPSPAEIEPDHSWLTLGGNNQHTHSSSVNVNPPLEVIWKRRVKSVVTDHPLAIGNNILALTKSGTLYELDYKTGKVQGDGTIGPAIDHVSTIHDNILYTGFSLGKKTLVGLNLESTKDKLEREYPNIYTTPLFWDDRLYFGTNKGLFLCINARSGEKIWDFKANSPIQSSPAIQDQSIIFGDDKGWIYALDASSGLKLWETALKGNIFSHPVIFDSLIFIGTTAGNLYALQYLNGKIIWQNRFPGAIFSSPSVYDNAIYIGNNDHKVIAMEKTTGEILWEFGTDGIVNTVPLPSPDYLYVASWDMYLYVLNRMNGKLLFKMNLKKALKSSPIIYKDMLLVQSANGYLYALGNEKLALTRRGK